MNSLPLAFSSSEGRMLAEEVVGRSGQNIMACYQCRRCAAGCPVGDETGITPDRLIRLIILGDRNAALENKLVWQCVSCYTCGTRCPNGIQTARVTETLKKMAVEEHVTPLSPKVKGFHDAFCAAARHMGRVNETEFMGLYGIRNTFHDLFRFNLKSIFNELKDQAKMGLEITRKKRMHFGIERVKDRSELKRFFKMAKDKKSLRKATSGSRG
jgi:heterodisulfide reductase subunit C